MRRSILIFSVLFVFIYSNAQNINFIKADPQPDLVEIYSGSFASGDIDADGDSDLIMAGITPARRTRIYLNDGNGNFTNMEDISLPNAANSTSILEDLDGDGDLDLLFAGNGTGVEEFAHIYLNDGSGVFTLTSNPSIPQFSDRGIGIADIDGDGDKDLLISVRDANDEFISDVFLNNGDAIFSPASSSIFTAVQFGQVEFIDVENDGDADVIISGEQEDGTALTRLYKNDGSGNFTIDANENFVQLKADDIDAADIDNDGDLDILMSGSTDAFEVYTILYINDGLGQFTELESANLQQTFAGKNSIEDLDNDGDLDIVTIGSQDGGLPNIYTIIYENLSNNVFIPVDTLGGEYIAACVIDDFNGDALADLIIQGFVDKTTVYWNNTVQTSVDEFANASLLSLFPNPTSGELNLKVESDIEESTLYIYTSEGQLVYQRGNFNSRESKLQLDLLPGSYVVLLRSEMKSVSRKLIIVR